MSRSVTFTPNSWDEYQSWQGDKKALKKVNALIKDAQRNGTEGIGKPEPLTGDLSGYWSRRITDKDRLVYSVTEHSVYILSCRKHYGDK